LGIPFNVQVSAERHITERGFTTATYRVPIGFENQIRRIFDLCRSVGVPIVENDIPALKINQIRVRVNQKFVTLTTDEERANLPEIQVVAMNLSLYAVCPFPECQSPIKVLERSRRYYNGNNFLSHLRGQHQVGYEDHGDGDDDDDGDDDSEEGGEQNDDDE
jgi:hypothetical protein